MLSFCPKITLSWYSGGTGKGIILAIIINSCLERVEVWYEAEGSLCTVQFNELSAWCKEIFEISNPSIAPWIFGGSARRLGLCISAHWNSSTSSNFPQDCRTVGSTAQLERFEQRKEREPLFEMNNLARSQKILHWLELVWQFVAGLIWRLSCNLCLSCLQWAMAEPALPEAGFHAKYIPPLFLLCLSGQGREEKSLHSLCSWQWLYEKLWDILAPCVTPAGTKPVEINTCFQQPRS